VQSLLRAAPAHYTPLHLSAVSFIRPVTVPHNITTGPAVQAGCMFGKPVQAAPHIYLLYHYWPVKIYFI
jgi:hypothetical protein